MTDVMQKPASLIVERGHVVTGDANGTRFERADIVIGGDRILAIGPDAAAPYKDKAGVERIDAGNAVVMPGLITRICIRTRASSRAPMTICRSSPGCCRAIRLSVFRS